MGRIRIAACQVNTIVGDLDGNVALVLDALEQAEVAGCDVAVFPEMALTGYPPEDLLLKPRFIAENLQVLEKVAAASGRCAAVVGFVDSDQDLFNAAAVCARGSVLGTYRKRLLPNYAVFDERRYFVPGVAPSTLFEIAGVRCGISICEDVWSEVGPMAEQAAGGAELLLNLNASPYYAGRAQERLRVLVTRVGETGCAVVYVNQVGGQDELVFDGGSMVLDAAGGLVASARQFVEDILVVDLDLADADAGRTVTLDLPVMTVTTERASNDDHRPGVVTPVLERVEEVYEALVLGTRDYVSKNGFTDVVIGLSGGVDSSLVAAVAVDALGAERVHGVSMPSRYSSPGSRTDADALATALGIDIRTIAIEPGHAALLEMLAPSFAGLDDDLTEENLQSRIRGVTLMALSNKLGWMVLTTGNKSEMAVGYSTLYGDTAGGFAVIKDVPKLLVYDLCRLVNRRAGRDVIPEAVLVKPPSAELRPDQRDDESLPPYEVLDPVLEAYVEDDLTAAELEEAGHDAAVVRLVVKLVDRAEYKRRQSPPGVRVSRKAFGKDRRVPITNRYTG